MRFRVVATLVVVVALALAGCGITRGSGKVVTESRVVSGFSSVALGGSGDLIVTQGDTEALTVEAEDNILPLIETRVSGGVLTIGFKPGDIPISTKPIVYRLTLRTLSAATLSGSGTVRIAALKADNLEVVLSGSGDIALQQLKAAGLRVVLSGSGNIDVAGEATQQDVSISGSGAYRAPELLSATTKAGISGSGSVTLWATGTLTTDISGSGSIGYYGKPAVTSTGSGSGSVKSLGDKTAP